MRVLVVEDEERTAVLIRRGLAVVVDAGPGMLRQAVDNLLANAVRHAPQSRSEPTEPTPGRPPPSRSATTAPDFPRNSSPTPSNASAGPTPLAPATTAEPASDSP